MGRLTRAWSAAPHMTTRLRAGLIRCHIVKLATPRGTLASLLDAPAIALRGVREQQLGVEVGVDLEAVGFTQVRAKSGLRIVSRAPGPGAMPLAWDVVDDRVGHHEVLSLRDERCV